MTVIPPDLPSNPRVKDFTDLDVWKIAREMRRQIYGLAKKLPDFEKFGLASQLRRAAVSVTANLAEGYGRFGYQENAQFCRQARGSVYELHDHNITCMDECFISKDKGSKLDAMMQRVIMMLNGYLRATLARKKSDIS
ncbi:MAG TPA: four helix bundle protein [Terriglobia bacterium]|nr:four helix bundle protein [Terriglobia bacterium]